MPEYPPGKPTILLFHLPVVTSRFNPTCYILKLYLLSISLLTDTVGVVYFLWQPRWFRHHWGRRGAQTPWPPRNFHLVVAPSGRPSGGGAICGKKDFSPALPNHRAGLAVSSGVKFFKWLFGNRDNPWHMSGSQRRQ